MSVDRRREMAEPANPSWSITVQRRLLSISRSSFCYRPQPESEKTLALMRVIDAACLDMPWYGSRQTVQTGENSSPHFPVGSSSVIVNVTTISRVDGLRRWLSCRCA